MPNENNTVKKRLPGIANGISACLPNKYGFALLVFNLGEAPDNECMYVSNCEREDIVKVMEEWIEATKEKFANDTGKY